MTIYLLKPARAAIDHCDFLDLAASMAYSGCAPGDPKLVSMLADISQTILADPKIRNVPQFVALAYWLRKSAVKQLQAKYISNNDADEFVLAPRGVALHLPPINVDTIFVYSWALSVLAGNSNIVRLAENCPTDTMQLAQLIATVVVKHGQNERQLFCQYPYGGEFEKQLNRLCDLRLIWGGDRKVNTVSALAIRPDGLSIGFPDRKSLSIIDAEAYESAADDVRDELASQMYNDIYWFSQMACGSPRAVIWVGSPSSKLTEDFYKRLCAKIISKSYAVETGTSIGKRALANDLLAEGIADQMRFISNELFVVNLVSPALGIERTHGGGFLAEWWVSDIAEIAAVISRKIQTLTYFGFSAETLRRFAVMIASRGGYRIVPIGQALNFDSDWDGVALLSHMTRRITVARA
jgi:hypothetical protein